ncbi:putative beta-lactamase-like 1 [Clarias magur]|uniref:Putative beta-lactamase-like 1 n=1 Tax=Clarias magur TaxID=1594786 RepID=A0A8J4UAX6_CLAMG|nr:putative beta-lactamase-like 1 [Clarias magur]
MTQCCGMGTLAEEMGVTQGLHHQNEYTVYRIATLSTMFPTLMLHKLWEDGKVKSLDDTLEKYAKNFTIKNAMFPKETDTEFKSLSNGAALTRNSKKHVPLPLSGGWPDNYQDCLGNLEGPVHSGKARLMRQ